MLRSLWPILSAAFCAWSPSLHAANCGCIEFNQGVAAGNVNTIALDEASGIASSRRNSGVLYSHNDGGSGRRLYALTLSGTHLATLELGRAVIDVEDIAVGPGPIPGVSYIYVGDIGGNINDAAQRSSVTIYRIPEPSVDPSWGENPRTQTFSGVESFTVNYPAGLHDAEALMVDPISGDVVVATKAVGNTTLFRANLNNVPNNGDAMFEFLAQLPIELVSAGDISPDGSQIILRNENFAALWTRCEGESLPAALDREHVAPPIIGAPLEPNGEGIAFLADKSGYVTISEGISSAIHLFQSACPAPPALVNPFADRSVLANSSVRLSAAASGYPAPTYTWTFNGQPLNNTDSSFFINAASDANAGLYEVTISNPGGTIRVAANLAIRPKPDLRITEIMPQALNGAADWWELTSFEPEPVDLTGWRFNDNTGGLADPFVLPAVTIAPRESIIFVEGSAAAQFSDWWGAANLPANLQIVTYTGAGLGLSASADAINLWNGSTTDPADTIAAANYSSAQTGIAFIYNPNTAQFGARAELDVLGVFRAASANDIGSPGAIQGAPSAPALITSIPQPGKIRLSFSAEANRLYILESAATADGSFSNAGQTFLAASAATAAFEAVSTSDAAFFRVRVVP